MYVHDPNETPNAKLAIFRMTGSYTNGMGYFLDITRVVLKKERAKKANGQLPSSQRSYHQGIVTVLYPIFVKRLDNRWRLFCRGS